MKFVLRVNPKILKQESFAYLEPSPVPPIVDPEDPEEAKDGDDVGEDENRTQKKEARKKPS